VSLTNNPNISVSLQFFPEGGYLCNKLVNTLAFKTTLPNGRGVNLMGTIFDENGQKIDSFKSTHYGMGKINFKGNAERRFYAVLNDFPSDTFYLPVAVNRPQIKFLGIKDSLVQFSLNDLSGIQSEKVYYLAVKAKGVLSFYFEKRFRNSGSNINIHVNNFTPGLNQVVLLDITFNPLTERLLYIPGSPKTDVSLAISSESFKTREKTQITLEIPDTADAAIGGSFSLAVLNLDQIGESDVAAENIISYLELSSEVRGQIENPGYYFSNPYEMVKEQLELINLIIEKAVIELNQQIINLKN